MRVQETKIPGCLEIFPQVLKDDRGCFVKTFHLDTFASFGLTTQFAEEYYTYSHQRVLRGLHFQLPPRDHVKIVTCVSGAVIDVALDLRAGSPAYGKHFMCELDADRATMLYLPPGIAHGFYVLSKSAILLYKVSSIYAPDHDAGILWSSAGISWPDLDPVLSPRDRCFPPLSEFHTPFEFGAERVP